MKCPKCRYVSHDYLDACRKCGVDLVSFKKNMGLAVLQPGGVLDLSLVLGEAGAANLFPSMGEELPVHAGHDDDFQIGLDDDSVLAHARYAHVEAPRARAQEPAEGGAGLDHLTIELDMSAMSIELVGSQPTAPAPRDTSPQPPTPAVPPVAAPEADMRPGHLTLDLGLASMDMAPPPELAESFAIADSLAAEHAEDVDLTMPVLELFDVEAAVESIETERGAEAPEAGESSNTTVDSFELPPETSMDEALFVSLADEPSDFAEVVVADLSPVAAPEAEEVSLWPEFELAPEASAAAAPEDALLSVDIAALEDLQDLEESTLSIDIAALEDLQDLEESALSAPLTPELRPPDPDPEQGVTPWEARPPGDREATALSERLTLDLDVSELMVDWSSAPLDDVQLDDLPGVVQSEMPSPQHQAGDEEELLLDLDNVEFDDDTPA